ncbi:ABC transporter ATP-binding protein [Nakamurella antarctica]|uniref:ABC transporter ATP-binding protein n=1 Tax=Nakamurella antarctica TaxID=1902245 RepID=A0A3G8ZIW3_9ACTN|nr:ABC transporter ATP-binding protein [Nakamurella antarctica]AZI57299.1 ABC transporter ATP-binding protein [Nakamurella antarctica]
MSEICFTGVQHAYGARVVLDGIDLRLSEQRIGIIGANGSGKSTLARMINGLVTPTEGSVTFDGMDVAHHGKDVRRKVGFIFTDPDNQIVMPTVGEDIAFTLRRTKLSKAEVSAKVSAIAHRFGLTDHLEHPAHLLSGGQKQLLALASVMVGEPAVLVADEPTTLLDARNARMIAQVLTDLPEQVVVVTHQLELLTDFDRVIVIEEGKVAGDDAPAKAISRYRALLELPS